MSATRTYNNNDIKGSRRKSIARLKSPIVGTPKNSPSSRGGSLPNSYTSNAPFLRKLYDDDADIAVESLGSSAESFKDPKRDGSGNSEEDLELNGENLSSGINDPKVIEKFERHLHGAKKKGLNHEGDDIVRDLYKLAGTEAGSTPRRSRSFSSFEATTPSRRGSTASSLNVPGGFRREFVISGRNNGIKSKPVNLITRNFVEFLSIYGHFAGEDLEDENDLIACHYGHVIPGSAVADEETALLPKNELQMNRTATDRKAYFLLLKAFVGTGVLFLPKAFSNGGLLFSTLTLLFFGFLSYWCYLTLIYAKRATGVSSFGDIAKKLCGTWLQRLIIVSIVLSQIGFVSAYIIFTAENLKAFYATIHSNIDLLNSTHFVLIQLAFFLPLSLVRDITKLSILALLANIFIFVGLASIVYYMIHDLIFVNKFQIADGVVFFFNKSGFSLFIGVAIFAFEGICLIIPIQESMINQDHFPKVLFQVILTISIIFIAIGSLGYYTYGLAVKTVILLNLPKGSPLVLLVQLLYAFAILLSTPLQLFPAIRLVEQKLFTRTGKHSITVKWLKNLFRFFSVSLTASIAIIGGSNLDRFVSFVGCFACIPLVYMYPPILHLKSCCLYDPSESKFENRKRFILGAIDYILVLVGGVALVYTTYQLLFT